MTSKRKFRSSEDDYSHVGDMVAGTRHLMYVQSHGLHSDMILGIPATFQAIRLFKTVVHTRRDDDDKQHQQQPATTKELIAEITFASLFDSVWNVCYDMFVLEHNLATHLPMMPRAPLRIIASYCKF
jgi:hypothetical protein